jgi:outer membrane protein OmpA-like peptidoglycan-associated protein
MKKLRSWQFTLVLLLSVLLILTFSLFSSTTAFNLAEAFGAKENKQSIPYLEKGMYLIVGAFQIPENAVQYSRSIKIKDKTPGVGRYRGNGMYYVYAYTTPADLEFARAKRTELRQTNQFYDAWILYVGLKLEDLLEKEETPDEVVINQPKELKAGDINLDRPKDREFIPPPPVEQDQNRYNYRFNVINATTLREVPGYVTIIDASRSKAMKSVSTNQIHQLEAPTTQSKEIIAMCDIFGFVKEQVAFKIDDPMSSEDRNMMEESGGITTIKFVLARHKAGEILTMYNVYFYNNSAIMKTESKFELISLLSMLKENEKLVIRIHGHTNGNAAGKIIKLREDDNNFFEITSNNIEGVGSAKELSKERADIIARWLLEQGINKKRMEIKGWGGKKMIYKKTDSMAGRNVRVEIEILKG